MARPTAVRLFEAVIMDQWPDGPAALVDFGLTGPDAQKRYEALHRGIRSGEITVEQLDAALGNGLALTTLVNGCPSNPHPGIKFHKGT